MAEFAIIDGATGVVTNVVIANALEDIGMTSDEAIKITESTGSGVIGSTWDPETQTFQW